MKHSHIYWGIISCLGNNVSQVFNYPLLVTAGVAYSEDVDLLPGVIHQVVDVEVPGPCFADATGTSRVIVDDGVAGRHS